MTVTVEATYEAGSLKLAEPLPFKEHERVTVTVVAADDWANRTYGMMGWKGDRETLRRIAEEDEFGLLESR